MKISVSQLKRIVENHTCFNYLSRDFTSIYRVCLLHYLYMSRRRIRKKGKTREEKGKKESGKGEISSVWISVIHVVLLNTQFPTSGDPIPPVPRLVQYSRIRSISSVGASPRWDNLYNLWFVLSLPSERIVFGWKPITSG